MLEQDDMLARFTMAEGGMEYLARLQRPDRWGDSLSLEVIYQAAGLSVWVLTVSEKGVPGLFQMGEEGWILAFLTQWPGHYDAFTVPEALQQAAKEGQLCLCGLQRPTGWLPQQLMAVWWVAGRRTPHTYSTAAARGGGAMEYSSGGGRGGGQW